MYFFFNILGIQLCEKNEFKCTDGTCISNTKHCDGNKDCPNGADELFCGMYVFCYIILVYCFNIKFIFDAFTNKNKYKYRE